MAADPSHHESPVKDVSHKIELLDLEMKDDDTTPDLSPKKGSLQAAHVNKSDSQGPEPLKGGQKPQSTNIFGKLLPKAKAPPIFEAISQGAQNAAKHIQREVPKAFQEVSTGAQNALTTAQEGALALARNSQAGAQNIIRGIPVPDVFAQTGDDFSDLYHLKLGKPGICSRCATIPLVSCFEPDSDDSAYSTVEMPLLRVILHAPWCRMCGLLLTMLCRWQHDPLRDGEVNNHMKEDVNRLSFDKYVSQGYIHKDEYWPFGRGEELQEESTQVLGTTWTALGQRAKERQSSRSKLESTQSAGTALIALSQRARGAQPSRVQPCQNNSRYERAKADREAYERGLKAGKARATRFRAACTLAISVSKRNAQSPGLLKVELLGRSNMVGAQERVLSNFMLRAVKDQLSVHFTHDHGLSYASVLHNERIETSIAKLWLTDCDSQHGTLCSEHGWSAAMPKPAFLRLIDLETLSLIEAKDPASCRYVALSYVWGGVNMLKLKRTNLDFLSSPEGLAPLLSDLPSTILDAKEVTQSLGERYLWIDSLCILQERTHEAQAQIDSMDAIYGNALLTIVAADGKSAQAGLRGVKRQNFGHEESQTPFNRAPQDVALNVVKGNVSVIAASPVQQLLSTKEWNTRAWTFQERKLSRRLLIFADNEMVWHCRRSIMKEAMPVEHSGYVHPPLDWLALKPQYLGIGVDSHWRDGSLETTRHGYTHVVRSGTFAEYAKMVEQYSERRMSYESDAINALAGLLRIFTMCFEAECVYGLPTSHLDIALLWRPKEALDRRDLNLGFPSWPWAAWRGKIAYEPQVRIKRDDSGEVMETEGIRPLLTYFRFDQTIGALQPLNGTGHGLPLADSVTPSEWEASGEEFKVSKPPELFDLDPRVIPELSDRLLIFSTRTIDALWLIDQVSVSTLPLSTQAVGSLIPDSGRLPNEILPEIHEFVLISEAQAFAVDLSRTGGDYSTYLVMIVERDNITGISRRLGVGKILKTAWNAVPQSRKLVYLG